MLVSSIDGLDGIEPLKGLELQSAGVPVIVTSSEVRDTHDWQGKILE